MTAYRSSRPAERARQALIRRSLHVCWLCGRKINVSLPGTNPQGPSLHHKVPLATGGSEHDPTNHALVHQLCNNIAGDMPAEHSQAYVKQRLGIPATNPNWGPAGPRTRDWGIK